MTDDPTKKQEPHSEPWTDEQKADFNETMKAYAKEAAKRFKDCDFNIAGILLYRMPFDYSLEECIAYLKWVRLRLKDVIKELEYTMEGDPKKAVERAPKHLARFGDFTYARAFGYHTKTLRAVDDKISEYEAQRKSQQLENHQTPANQPKEQTLTDQREKDFIEGAEKQGREPKRRRQRTKLSLERLVKETGYGKKTLYDLIKAKEEFRQELDRAFERGRKNQNSSESF
jgi:hypothetical protein